MREEYRDSLHVSAAELERQRRHEVDLAKVIARLYRSYLDELVAAGQLTRADAIAEATRLLGSHPAAAASARATVEWAFIDDAQDLGIGELRFLQALFGERLARATFAGDAAQTTQTFAGARPERTFALAAQTFVLEANHRVPPAVAGAARLVVDPRHLPLPAAVPPEPAVRLRRVSQQAREAQALADDVTALLASGTAPEAIAVVARGLVGCAPYADALLERDVAITFAGAFDLFDDPDAEDALALLWSACDPFRHDYLLRALQGPTMRLSDASLQILCSEPPNPQTLLFELPGEEANAAASRWDRRRDLRLAMNVTRGDRDAHLAPEARERLVRFRERRARWASLARAYPAEAVADVAFAEGGLLERRRGETAARLHKRLAVLAHLREEIVACCKLERSRTLADFLASTQTLAASEDRLVNCMPCAQGAVVIGSVEGVKGAQFDHVFIVNVRAGAFPPYYAPDSFLFSPNYGMIPKDNVGDASAARTAKFTWYMHHAKLRETFVAEERRALACAMTRARRSVTLSTWGKRRAASRRPRSSPNSRRAGSRASPTSRRDEKSVNAQA